MEASSSQLAAAYFAAFGSKDLSAIHGMLSPEVVLQDPIVGKVCGREAVLAVYAQLFESFRKIHVQLGRIYSRSESSWAVEFSLQLMAPDGSITRVSGVDCIEFHGQEIVSLRAYLDTSAVAAD